MDEFINNTPETENNIPENPPVPQEPILEEQIPPTPVSEPSAPPVPPAPATGFGDNDFSVKNFENSENGDIPLNNTEEQPSAPFEQVDETVRLRNNIPNQPPFNNNPYSAPNFYQNNIPNQNGFQNQTPPPNPYYSQPVYNPINFTDVKPVKEHKPMSRGLKFFALIMAFVFIITGSSLTGYFIGKNGVKSGFSYGEKVSVNLASKPKDTNEMTEAQVYEAANKSVVGIVVYNNNGKSSQASGIIYTKDGYIVTNDHIYSEVSAPKFKIYTHDGTEYDAKYVAGDIISDLAVLKIDSKENFTPAEFGNSNELFYGEHVVAIGRPSDATDKSSITRGIISAVSRRVRTTSNYTSRLIQTDSAINPGSSGGALLNMYGQVIGVTSSKLASVEYDAVGYAIPTVTMKRIVEELIEHGKVISRAKLGVSYTAIDSVTAEINNYDYVGLYISTVSEDSDLYGKVEEGDIITHINGQLISDDEVILDIIEQCSAGDKISVTIVTNSGATKNIDAVLKANVGESSYNATESLQDSEENSEEFSEDGPTFNFPFGE